MAPGIRGHMLLQLPSSQAVTFHYIIGYPRVAALTFALLEIIATLPDEIALVWPANISIMKIVYFVNKYSCLGDTILSITVNIFAYDPNASADSLVHVRILSYVYILGMTSSELILVARTVALWKRNKYVVIFLSLVGMELSTFALFATLNAVGSLGEPRRDTMPDKFLCIPRLVNVDVWPAFMCLILAEGGIMFLTLLKKYSESYEERSYNRALRLYKIMYRDGTYFFAIVLAMSVLNLVVMLTAPEGLTSLMQMPLRVVHSALCTRVMLNLRKAARATSEMTLNDYPQ
ncbi:hypothetical protein C8Q74DRAFT_1370967 [Fomes fomentarius]|nr:hypothetical protein C8Q74DRAFT_1370967 [Fomes fomentarius]